MALAPIDAWTLGYAAFSAGILALRWNAPLPQPALLVLAHVLLAAAALLAPRARRAGSAGRFLGEFYPLIVVVAFYTEIGIVNASAGLSQDGRVQAWEEALFGGQPSRAWIRACPWPVLSWVMHLGYLSYYLILAAAPLGLWVTGRRQAARRTLLTMLALFYVCYAIFLLFPVAGPRYAFPLARNAATAVPVAALAQQLLDHGAAWGTAFPSSHVAVALAAAVSAGRGWRALGAVLLPAAVLLAFGTVYGQFHYAVDAIGGALLAVLVLLGPARPRHGSDPRHRSSQPTVKSS